MINFSNMMCIKINSMQNAVYLDRYGDRSTIAARLGEEQAVCGMIRHRIYMHLQALTSGISISQCIDSLLVFCNTHMMLSHRNKLAVIAAHSSGRYLSQIFVYKLIYSLSTSSTTIIISLQIVYTMYKFPNAKIS